MVVDYFKVLSLHLLGQIEETRRINPVFRTEQCPQLRVEPRYVQR